MQICDPIKCSRHNSECGFLFFYPFILSLIEFFHYLCTYEQHKVE